MSNFDFLDKKFDKIGMDAFFNITFFIQFSSLFAPFRDPQNGKLVRQGSLRLSRSVPA